jgi:hypothetical protein
MAKKLFLDNHREFPISEIPSVMEERTEPETVLPDRSSPEHEISDELPYEILDETSKSFPKLNQAGLVCSLNLTPQEKSRTLSHTSRNALQGCLIT